MTSPRTDLSAFATGLADRLPGIWTSDYQRHAQYAAWRHEIGRSAKTSSRATIYQVEVPPGPLGTSPTTHHSSSLG